MKIYPVGTLLLAMYGQGKTRGQVSILGIEASTSQNAAAITPTRIDSVYLWQFLLSQYVQLRAGGAHGHISHLNLGYVKKFRLPLPERGEQERIAVTLLAIDKRINAIEGKLMTYQNLFKTLLHELMSGERRVKRVSDTMTI